MNILRLTKLMFFKRMDDFLDWNIDVGHPTRRPISVHVFKPHGKDK